jgi:hypothetical protein
MRKWSTHRVIQSKCCLAIQELIHQLNKHSYIKLKFIKLGAVQRIAEAMKLFSKDSELLSGLISLADLFYEDEGECELTRNAQVGAAAAFVNESQGIKFVASAMIVERSTTAVDFQQSGCLLLSRLSRLGDFRTAMKENKIRSIVAKAAERHENHHVIQAETSNLYVYMSQPATTTAH